MQNGTIDTNNASNKPNSFNRQPQEDILGNMQKLTRRFIEIIINGSKHYKEQRGASSFINGRENLFKQQHSTQK